MSVLIIQVGQCGNQIGSDLFTIFANCAFKNLESPNLHYSSFAEDIISKFFNESPTTCSKRHFTANAVLIDTENKVIGSVCKKRKCNWSYPKEIETTNKPTQGSGNNWAYGYKVHGPQQEQHILDSIQRGVERCNSFSGFVILQSLAGGTGSGLGTYVTELIRREYPHSFILNQVIWPFISGEVSVQHYNAILALPRLVASSDLVLNQRNDEISLVCSQHLSQDNVSFAQLNEVIASNLAAILAPMTTTSKQSNNSLGDLVSHCCSDVRLKLYDIVATPYISIRSRPFANNSWASIVKNINLHPLSAKSRVYLQGVDLPSEQDMSKFTDINSCQGRSPRIFQRRFSGLSNYDRRATALIEGNISILEQTLARCWPMFTRRAFVHRYERIGVTTSDLLDSFSACEQMLLDFADRNQTS